MRAVLQVAVRSRVEKPEAPWMAAKNTKSPVLKNTGMVGCYGTSACLDQGWRTVTSNSAGVVEKYHIWRSRGSKGPTLVSDKGTSQDRVMGSERALTCLSLV